MFMRDVTDVCRNLVVSALGTVLMFWSESEYAALVELRSPRRCVCRKWSPPLVGLCGTFTDVCRSGGGKCPCYGRSCSGLTPYMLFF